MSDPIDISYETVVYRPTFFIDAKYGTLHVDPTGFDSGFDSGFGGERGLEIHLICRYIQTVNAKGSAQAPLRLGASYVSRYNKQASYVPSISRTASP